MCHCADSKGIVDAFAAAVPWILVIAGWFFVAQDHDRRERRKELRLALTKLIERIHACEKEAHEYWMLPPESERAAVLGVSVKRLLQAIAAERLRLEDSCGMATTAREIISLRRACTGGDFERTNRAAEPAASARLSSISESAIDLVEKLETEFALFTDRSLKSSLRQLVGRQIS